MNDKTKEMNETIKGCPFCGGTASITECPLAGSPSKIHWIIGCDNEDCEIMVPGFALRKDAVKFWNKRAPEAPETEVVKLIPCPNCKQPYGEIMPYEVERYLDLKYGGRCSGCGYEDGNRCDDIPSAIIEWNSAVSTGSEDISGSYLEMLDRTRTMLKKFDVSTPRPVDGMEERAVEYFELMNPDAALIPGVCNLMAGFAQSETQAMAGDKARLLEALTWCVGWMRVNARSALTYDDYKNAESLIDGRGIEFGEFQKVSAQSELMTEELKEARRVIERYADEERTTFSPQSARIAQDYLSKYPKETE